QLGYISLNDTVLHSILESGAQRSVNVANRSGGQHPGLLFRGFCFLHGLLCTGTLGRVQQIIDQRLHVLRAEVLNLYLADHWNQVSCGDVPVEGFCFRLSAAWNNFVEPVHQELFDTLLSPVPPEARVGVTSSSR